MRKIGLQEILLSSGTFGIKLIKFCDHIFGTIAAACLLPQAFQKPPLSISSILVIRPGGIGDAVFLLPVLKAIKIRFPQISIDVLCQKRNAEVFQSQEDLADHVFVYGSPSDLSILGKNQYSAIVDTEQWHYLTAISALMFKTKCRTGFGTRPLRRKLFNINVDYDHDAYELDNFFRLFESLTGALDRVKNIKDCFKLPQELLSWGKAQIPSNSVTISLGASVPERRLSTEQIITLAQGILSRGYHPVLLGGQDVGVQSREVMLKLNKTLVYDFVGKTTLFESVALIRSGRLFIGTDSGLMHLACATGVSVIALFGPGQMKKWMSPTEGQISINEQVPCSPCTFFGYGLPVCRGTFHCLRKMDLPAVLERHLPLGVMNG